MTGTILNAVTAAVMAVWPFFVLNAVTNGLMTLLLLAGTACVLGVRLALAFAGRGAAEFRDLCEVVQRAVDAVQTVRHSVHKAA